MSFNTANLPPLLISVVTPTFNRIEFLKHCIKSVQESVLNPLDFKFEHIVIDDGSSDDTKVQMPQLEKQYVNLKYLRNEENKGGSRVLNQGISLAKGEWIFVLDDDDVTFQRSMFNFANSLKNYGDDYDWFVFDFIRADQNLQYLIGQDYYGWEFENVKSWLSSMVNKKHVIQHNTLFKKLLWESVGGYDENLRNSKDTDLYLRFVLEKQKLPKYLPFFSHIHRFHDSNISNFDTNDNHNPNPAWLETVFAKYPQLDKYRLAKSEN